jgi:phage regulator Rha-like protein
MGFTGAKAAQFKEAYIKAFNQMEKQLHEQQQQLPATTPNTALLETSFQETEKYQLLNDMIKSLKLESNPVVIPSKELVDLIQAVRMYQTQIAQLRTPDWVNDNITRMKDLAKRNFTDF